MVPEGIAPMLLVPAEQTDREGPRTMPGAFS